jgi:phenylalanyl-tRNA synthetase, alpha subunit (EC 6.1.1.20)
MAKFFLAEILAMFALIMLQDRITQYTEEIKAFVPSSSADVENFRLKFLVSKGIVKNLFDEFKTVTPDEKRTLGKVLNEFKQLAENTFKEAQEKFGSGEKQKISRIG